MRQLFSFLTILFLLTACGSDDEEVPAPEAVACPALSPVEESAKSAQGHQRYIVKLSARAKRLGAKSFLRTLPKRASAQRLQSDLYLLKLPAALTAAEVSASENYEFMEPDYKVFTTLASDDDSLHRQWAHEVVQSAEAWDIERGNRNVLVAVLDSGVDYNHPDLADNIWTNPGETMNGVDDDGNGFVDDLHGWNFVDNNNTPIADDRSFHGTHVAGTVGAVGNNGIGISGQAQLVRLLPLKFLGADGSGFSSDAIRGIDYAIQKGAHIINNSWGSGSRSTALSQAIDRARQAGILFVAAAGNSSRNNDVNAFYPSNYPQDNIVRVAATDVRDRLASFSNYGSSRVDVGAPGANIYSTKNGGAYQNLSGTSMATPLVSGLLATMLASRPDLSYLQLKGVLLETVDPTAALRGRVLSNGRVNAFRALSRVRDVPADWQPPVFTPLCP